jgi:hypothetical protein
VQSIEIYPLLKQGEKRDYSLSSQIAGGNAKRYRPYRIEKELFLFEIAG